MNRFVKVGISRNENQKTNKRRSCLWRNMVVAGMAILVSFLAPLESMCSNGTMRALDPIDIRTTIRGEERCLNFNIGSNRAVKFKLTIGENPPVPGGSLGPVFKTGAWWGGWDSGTTSTTFWQHSFCGTTPSTIYYYVLSIYDPILEKYEYMTGAALTAQMDLKIALAAISMKDSSDEMSGCECEFNVYANGKHLYKYGDKSVDNWIDDGDVHQLSGFERYLIDVGRNSESLKITIHGCDLDQPSGFFLDPETYADDRNDCSEGHVIIPFESYTKSSSHKAVAGGDLSFTAFFAVGPRYVSRLTSTGQVYKEENVAYPPPEIMIPTANSMHWDSKPISTSVLVLYPADVSLEFTKKKSDDSYEIYKKGFISKRGLVLQNGLLVGNKKFSIDKGKYKVRAQAQLLKVLDKCPPDMDEENGNCYSKWSRSIGFSIGDDDAIAKLKLQKNNMEDRVKEASSNLVLKGDSQAEQFELTNPNGGEQWNKESTYDITWNKGDKSGNFKIVLLKNGAVHKQLKKKISVDVEQFEWTIGSKIPKGDDYKIRLVSREDSNILVESDNVFSIDNLPQATSLDLKKPDAVFLQDKVRMKKKVAKSISKSNPVEQQGTNKDLQHEVIKKEKFIQIPDLDRKIFKVISPIENNIYHVGDGMGGDPESWEQYETHAYVEILVYTSYVPEKTKIIYSIKRKTGNSLQFKDMSFTSDHPKTSMYFDGNKYRIQRLIFLPPGLYELKAYPDISGIRPNDVKPIHFKVMEIQSQKIGLKEQKLPETTALDLNQLAKVPVQSKPSSLNKEGAISVRRIFRVLNPEKNHEYKARVEGSPKKGYRERGFVNIRIRSPQKTKISFLLKQRLFGEQQFKDFESWISEEDDMRWMKDFEEYQYMKRNSLEPAQYYLIANPHKLEIRPDDLGPIRFTVFGKKELEMRARLKSSATLEKKENGIIPHDRALTRKITQSKFEVLSPPDGSLQHKTSLTVKIGSPEPVAFNFRLQEVLPDGMGLKVPMKMNINKGIGSFIQEGGRWISMVQTVPLDRGMKYQVTVEPYDSIVKGKMWSRFTIFSQEALEKLKKVGSSSAIQMKKSPVIEPSIVLGGKRSLNPNESATFMVKGEPVGKPQVECFDGRRWSRKCAKGIKLQKMGIGAQTRYSLRTKTPGKYRLRIGKLLSDEIKVVELGKTAGQKVASSGKQPAQVTPLDKRAPQEKKQTKIIQKNLKDTKKKMPVKFDKPKFSNLKNGQSFPGGSTILFNLKLNPAFKKYEVKYEVYQNECKGKPYKVSTKNNFGKLPAGKYCVRAAYMGGEKMNWSKGIPFVVEKNKKKITTPKKNISPHKIKVIN